MRCVKLVCFLIATLITCISYANTNENKYVFVGQTGNETSFVLEIIDDNMDNIAINENGEVWIKVDKIIAVPKAELKEAQATLPIHLTSYGAFGQSLFDSKSEAEVRCPQCRYTYVPGPPTWSCPRCK